MYSRYRLVVQSVGALGAAFNTQCDIATFILNPEFVPDARGRSVSECRHKNRRWCKFCDLGITYFC